MRPLHLFLALLIAARAGAADTTPPAAVTLAATAGIGNATLSWTAPGDDGNVGTAHDYDVRVSTAAIDSSNWATATPLDPSTNPAPTPLVAGTAQSMVVSPLLQGVVYHFALVTFDAAGNASPVSNDVAVTALPDPPVITSPITRHGARGGGFTYDIVAVGTVDSYGATPLPPGLAFNGTTGVLSGTPTTNGIYPVTISATNTGGTDTKTLTITITDPGTGDTGNLSGGSSGGHCGLGAAMGLMLAALSLARRRAR